MNLRTRLSSISSHVVQFGRFLRQHDFAATIDDKSNALLALQEIDFNKPPLFHLTLKSIFCKNTEQINKFDDLFNQYWKEHAKAVDSKTIEKPKIEKRKIPAVDQLKALQSWLHGNKNNEEEHTALYSIHENMAQKDFSLITDDEIDEIEKTIKSIARKLTMNFSRRLEKSNQAAKLDLQQTLRKNIRYGSEMLHLFYREPKPGRTKLVLLCDVSKSMDLYSRFFLQFMYALQHSFMKMETFIFSTDLIRISALLKQNNFEAAMTSLSGQTGWSGGTKIGESLQRFNEDYSTLINKQTMIIILSDGWDTGESELIEYSENPAKKVIWLNPLAGFSEYQPSAKGMQSAMPYVDGFFPLHNLESLRKLGRVF
jgi:uncharacterized protein